MCSDGDFVKPSSSSTRSSLGYRCWPAIAVVTKRSPKAHHTFFTMIVSCLNGAANAPNDSSSAAPAFLAGVGCSALVRPFPAHQWEAFRMLDRFHSQIDVKVGPVQMVRMRKFHVQQLSHRNVSEPGELLEWQEKLPPPKQKPESM